MPLHSRSCASSSIHALTLIFFQTLWHPNQPLNRTFVQISPNSDGLRATTMIHNKLKRTNNRVTRSPGSIMQSEALMYPCVRRNGRMRTRHILRSRDGRGALLLDSVKWPNECLRVMGGDGIQAARVLRMLSRSCCLLCSRLLHSTIASSSTSEVCASFQVWTILIIICLCTGSTQLTRGTNLAWEVYWSCSGMSARYSSYIQDIGLTSPIP